MRVMAAELIRGVTAVVSEVAQLRALHTVAVGALELRVGVAGLHARRAQRHVVLVGAVTAVIHTVTHLVSERKMINWIKTSAVCKGCFESLRLKVYLTSAHIYGCRSGIVSAYRS